MLTRGEVCAALARAAGRFEESWGSELDATDPTDLEALGYLLHDELEGIARREETDAAALAEIRRRIEEWGNG